MQKIPTLFRRDPDDLRRVTREVHPACQWVLDGEGVPTRKYDGTCVRLDDAGTWWARREVKPGKSAPAGFAAVQTDPETGKTVGWEPVAQSAFAKFFDEPVRASSARCRAPTSCAARRSTAIRSSSASTGWCGTRPRRSSAVCRATSTG
ncbi:hypothetical protein [Amycolatopsis sp. cmx-8-4]|uniref:hypothetical protein n=1 Tax=Amycolatopsis sp. cmx-8-4 TaxID=2790947 RepID=UPI00397A4A67